MKNHPTNPPQDHSADEPIIRPLEQRRVPSATGAAFALPVLPEADEAPVDEIPVDVEGDIAVDTEVIDPVFIEDPLPFEFDEVVKMIDGEAAEGDLGEPLIEDAVFEEFNPDVIFYTLFTPGVVEEGGEEIYEEEFTGEEEVIDEGEIFEGEVLEGEIIETTGLDKDGDGFDDVTGESLEKPIYTIDMVMRGDGQPVNPEVLYMSATGGPAVTTGGPVPTTDAAGGADTDGPGSKPETTADSSTDHSPSPVHQPASTVATQATTAPTEQGAAVEISFESGNAAPSVILPVSTSTGATPDEVNIPNAPAHGTAASDHDAVDFHFAPAPVTFGSASGDQVASGAEGNQDGLTVDSWVPAVSEPTGFITHLDSLTAEGQTEHSSAAAPVDAGATASHSSALRGSAAAMAATGAVLLSRDVKKRDEKEQA